MGVLGTGLHHVKTAVTEATSEFDRDGLLTHETGVTALEAITIGARLDLVHHRSTLTQKRYWRVRQAFRFGLRCRRLPGHVWEVLVGHATYCGLAERGSLSIFSSIYSFIAKHYYEATPLWDSAAAGIRAFIGIMPLLQSSWRRPWCSVVGATDASLDGYGVCWADLGRDVVAAAGRLTERSRLCEAQVGLLEMPFLRPTDSVATSLACGQPCLVIRILRAVSPGEK